MKKNEIALLVVIVGIALMSSYAIVNSIIGGGKAPTYSVKKIEPVAATVVDPALDANTVFNKDAFNPTVKVKIGDQTNQQVFSGQ